MKLCISINNSKPEDKKKIINSIKGVVKAFSKRFGFEFTFEEW